MSRCIGQQETQAEWLVLSQLDEMPRFALEVEPAGDISAEAVVGAVGRCSAEGWLAPRSKDDRFQLTQKGKDELARRRREHGSS